jgi:hypothetical protein
MLPLKLLTPFQAENDHHIKDTYNYVTIQVSIAVCAGSAWLQRKRWKRRLARCCIACACLPVSNA